mgnify:CR=1 FL=1
MDSDTKKTGIDRQQTSTLPLMRNNFIIMIIAGALIVLGFVLMVGGSAEGADFNPGIFSTTRIVVGPLLAFVGFVLMGAGIIIRPKK